MPQAAGIRINKFLSESGLCSRREADRMIEQGRVTINGKHPEVGQRVQRRDKVRVDGREVDNRQEASIYLVFNKPVGVVTTTETREEKNNIIEYVNYPKRIFPVGRLDKDSEGLILLTSDGDIVNKILRAGNNHEKEYEVTVNKAITEEFIKKMAGGIPIMGTMTRKCKVDQITPFVFSIVLTQGMNRQIRRMCEYLGYEVQRLKRTRIMNLKLDLPSGEWRELTESELAQIEDLLKDSSKTQKAKSTGNQASKPKDSRSKTGNAPPSGRFAKSRKPANAAAGNKKKGRKSGNKKAAPGNKGRQR